MAMLPDMLRRDRERWGMSVGEAGWRLGIKRRTQSPNADTYDAICTLIGLPILGASEAIDRLDTVLSTSDET